MYDIVRSNTATAQMATYDGSKRSVCEDCSERLDDHTFITILNVGASSIRYTVPSFPVFSANLREVKFQGLDDRDCRYYDGYIRDTPNLKRSFPALLKLCSGYTNAFVIDPDEFDHCIPIGDKIFYEKKVFVIWKWTWEESAEDIEQESTGNMSDESIGESSGEDNDADLNTSLLTHSVIFKCMGATKTVRSQEILAEAAQKLKKEESVGVMLRKEPKNPKDSRAIAFDCKLKNDWELIGYVAKEALNSVHEAIDSKKILSIKFEWIRFITHWSRSGAGWYCGIKISKLGEWPKEVVRCSSSF